MLFRSHHEGKATREIPIFPELRPYLEQAWDEVGDDGAEFVIRRYRDPSTNLRTHLCRIIRKAGLEPWEKVWQNLRSSRATELAKEHPAYVAAAWLGHSTLVAQKHYWQVTADDFSKAIGCPSTTDSCSSKNVANFVATVSSKGPQTQTATVTNPALFRRNSQVAVGPLPPSGLERPHETREIVQPDGNCAKFVATPSIEGAESTPTDLACQHAVGDSLDADLARLVELWPTLSPAARRQIVALVKSGEGRTR